MHTLLILAAGNLAEVKFLLSKGADPRVCDIFEETCLHYTAEGGHLDIVKALVEAGSDLQLLDIGGRTPLRCAQLNHHSAVVDYLAPRTRAVENLRVDRASLRILDRSLVVGHAFHARRFRCFRTSLRWCNTVAFGSWGRSPCRREVSSGGRRR